MPVRKGDGRRIRVYRPRDTWACRHLGTTYYRAHIHEGAVAAVMLPDGESFLFEPADRERWIYLPTDRAKRARLRSRTFHFQLEVGA